jgi:hypothetical protein
MVRTAGGASFICPIVSHESLDRSSQKVWITDDVRNDRKGHQRWLNAIFVCGAVR